MALRPVLLIAILLAAPAAQGFNVIVDPPTQMIRPEVEVQPLTVQISLPCQEALSVLAPGSNAATVRLDMTVPDYVPASGPETVLMSTNPCSASPTGVLEETIEWQVGMTRAAPAVQAIRGVMEAELEDQNPAPFNDPSGPIAVLFDVAAEYEGLLHARAPEPIIQAKPGQTVQVPLIVTNEGNAKTVVTFHTDDWNGIESPGLDPIVVGTANTGDVNVQEVTLEFRVPSKPGWNNELKTLSLELRPSAFDDPDRSGEPVTVDLLFRIRGQATVGDEPFAVDGAAADGYAFVTQRWLPLALPGVLLALAIAFARRRRS